MGLVARDVTDEFNTGVTWDVGASIVLPSGLLLGADLVDATVEIDSLVRIGAEYPLQQSPVIVRAGLNDGDPTVGAGYVFDGFEVAAAWADYDWDDEFVVSVLGSF
ncbi:MAG: hypothetical protein GF393_00840 [Armatimonadia bacterium]|nr:hypothetical protein [Armatimonadia bacterium]